MAYCPYFSASLGEAEPNDTVGRKCEISLWCCWLPKRTPLATDETPVQNAMLSNQTGEIDLTPPEKAESVEQNVSVAPSNSL